MSNRETGDLKAHLARWSQSLMGIAKIGLAFANSPYDVGGYEELVRLAAEMTATVNTRARPDLDPAASLPSAWCCQVEEGREGHTTPKVSVGAIVFNGQDEILLVHSSILHDRCFPVAMADVGYSPTESARKEVPEETGLHVTPVQPMGVGDSLRGGFILSLYLYNLLFYCRLEGGELEPQTEKMLEAGFFD